MSATEEKGENGYVNDCAEMLNLKAFGEGTCSDCANW